MARLYLRFEKTNLKSFGLTQSGVTIGRLPDNDIQIDNPAVSGHHARVFWDRDHFAIQDTKSFNGTYVNDHRVTAQALTDNDVILIGKHTLTFRAEPAQSVAPASTLVIKPTLPAIESTAMLDTKKARELLAQAMGKGHAATPAPAATGAFEIASASKPMAEKKTGILSIVSGKTDQPSYVLTGKLTVIGKSDMASIRLRGWFAPQVAGAISRRDDRYFIASGGRQKVKINGQPIAGQWELQPGDTISLAKVSMTFGYND